MEDLTKNYEQRHKILLGRETLARQLKRYEELIEEIERIYKKTKLFVILITLFAFI